MSLWKVDDEATQMLMTNFYSNWTKTPNKLKAFKQAQLRLMAKYKEPYYWGRVCDDETIAVPYSPLLPGWDEN